jgi:hypothetical protein
MEKSNLKKSLQVSPWIFDSKYFHSLTANFTSTEFTDQILMPVRVLLDYGRS